MVSLSVSAQALNHENFIKLSVAPIKAAATRSRPMIQELPLPMEPTPSPLCTARPPLVAQRPAPYSLHSLGISIFAVLFIETNNPAA